MRRRKLTVGGVVILLLFILLQQYFPQSSPSSSFSPTPSSFQTIPTQLPKASTSGDLVPMLKVIDGDTIDVTINNEKERVRLIGINTPETVDPRRRVECFGKEASQKMKELLTGHMVRLVPDTTQDNRDTYKRLLRYVYRDDGLFVNNYLIEEGYAYEYTYQVPYLFQAAFKASQEKARNEGRGLWREGVCEE